MLSVNIPVFETEVSGLVFRLEKQAEKLGIAFEIRVYDDGSGPETQKANRSLESLPGIVYREMAKNLGRAAIRNKMGNESVYPFLLFIDADSKIVADDYLAKFIQNARENLVVCGGTAYATEMPQEMEKRLRWKYGTGREAVPAAIRNGKKGFIITSNNFLIPKSVLQRIPFREDLRKYGHEDTLLGFDLHRNGISVLHIDNPVEHTGLENAAAFLEKTRSALRNLHFIANKLLDNNQEFVQQVHFLNRYRAIVKIVPASVLRSIFMRFRTTLEKHLSGKNPSLFLFDLYKLMFYSTLK